MAKHRGRFRVAFVMSTISGKGGPQRFMAEVGRQLSVRGHEVHYVSWFFDPPRTFAEFRQLDVSAARRSLSHRVLSRILSGRWGTSSPKIMKIPLSVFTNPLLILRSIVEVNPDVVVVSSGHTLSFLFARLHRGLIVCRYPALPSTLLDSPLARFLKPYELATMGQCLAFVNSHSVAKEVLARLGICLPVINPGVDFERFSSVERNDDGRTLLYLSRIRPNKNQAFLVALMPRILEEHEVRLVLAGEVEDSDKPYLMHLQEQIEQLGLNQVVDIRTEPRDINDAYSQATIYLHPAAGEPFGMTIVEAMASGLPVVVHKTVGARDVVGDGESGFLVGDDPADWAKKIGVLLSNRDLYTLCSEEARKRARQFSWSHVASRFEELLWSALDARDGG